MPKTEHATTQQIAPYIPDSFRMLLNVTKKNLLNEPELQIIKGELGIGKTTFCKQLQHELKKCAQTIIIDSNKNLSAGDVFRKMLFSYHQKPKLVLNICLASLTNYLKTSIKSVGTIVIIIDDCHLISSKNLEHILQRLYALNDVLKSNIKLLLIGEPSLVIGLNEFNVEKIIHGQVHSSVIRPIVKAHYLNYLEQHLKSTSSVAPLVLNDITPKQLELLYTQSKGIPLLINQSYVAMFKQTEESAVSLALHSSQNHPSTLFEKIKRWAKNLV